MKKEPGKVIPLAGERLKLLPTVGKTAQLYDEATDLDLGTACMGVTTPFGLRRFAQLMHAVAMYPAVNGYLLVDDQEVSPWPEIGEEFNCDARQVESLWLVFEWLAKLITLQYVGKRGADSAYWVELERMRDVLSGGSGEYEKRRAVEDAIAMAVRDTAENSVIRQLHARHHMHVDIYEIVAAGLYRDLVRIEDAFTKLEMATIVDGLRSARASKRSVRKLSADLSVQARAFGDQNETKSIDRFKSAEKKKSSSSKKSKPGPKRGQKRTS